LTLTPSSDLISIDLFAGAGGLSEGLEEAGFHTLFASEIVPQYAETYARNHPRYVLKISVKLTRSAFAGNWA